MLDEIAIYITIFAKLTLKNHRSILYSRRSKFNYRLSSIVNFVTYRVATAPVVACVSPLHRFRESSRRPGESYVFVFQESLRAISVSFENKKYNVYVTYPLALYFQFIFHLPSLTSIAISMNNILCFTNGYIANDILNIA